MLATFTNRRFSDPNWIFEYKLDGERCLAFKRSNGVRLLSRRLRTDKPAKDVVRARPQLSP